MSANDASKDVFCIVVFEGIIVHPFYSNFDIRGFVVIHVDCDYGLIFFFYNSNLIVNSEIKLICKSHLVDDVIF